MKFAIPFGQIRAKAISTVIVIEALVLYREAIEVILDFRLMILDLMNRFALAVVIKNPIERSETTNPHSAF